MTDSIIKVIVGQLFHTGWASYALGSGALFKQPWPVMDWDNEEGRPSDRPLAAS
jgi:hypothetical protein